MSAMPLPLWWRVVSTPGVLFLCQSQDRTNQGMLIAHFLLFVKEKIKQQLCHEFSLVLAMLGRCVISATLDTLSPVDDF
jgi:hypothetical protein